MNGNIQVKNIYEEIPINLTEEIFEVIIVNQNIKIERIISMGHKSPPNFWYEQEKSEWVILLKGYAEILFENESCPKKLYPGDYLNIPAYKKHRVEKTDEKEETIWLAVFYD